MGKIVLLDDLTVNKIAAGEVVERPVAVVKELVENAIDAGASRIDITVTGGGLDSIRVADNGSGMAPEDVPISLQRHATSKIRQASDLNSVKTLGFRGEALPSIAAVSRLRVVTGARKIWQALLWRYTEGGWCARKSTAARPAQRLRWTISFTTHLPV
jgi:DNA mismatch repair protein MutL